MLGQFAPLENRCTGWFTCHACGLTREPFNCRARAPSEGVVWFMLSVVGRECGVRHGLKSLWCKATHFDVALAFADDADYVGQALKHTHADEVAFGLGEGT